MHIINCRIHLAIIVSPHTAVFSVLMLQCCIVSYNVAIAFNYLLQCCTVAMLHSTSYAFLHNYSNVEAILNGTAQGNVANTALSLLVLNLTRVYIESTLQNPISIYISLFICLYPQ